MNIDNISFGNSPIAKNVGYLRFATGGGAEALPPPGYNDGGPCQAAWTVAGYSYLGWNAHEARIISAMGCQDTDKQIMASLPYVSGGPDVYTVANTGAAVAAAPRAAGGPRGGGRAPTTTPGPSRPPR